MPAALSPWRGRILWLALALGLNACTSVPRGMLQPVKPVPGTERVDMLAATTRAPSLDPGVLFSGDRGDTVSFANIVVSIPRDRQVGTIQLPRTVPGNPETDFAVLSATPIAKSHLAGWFKTTSGRKRRVFVFVHGFNTPFDRAVFRFAQLTYDADADAAPVLFSWPSRGRLLDYSRDFDNASYSRSDLAYLLKVAASSPSVGEIVILAHSMGSWPAVEAVRQLALERGGVPRKIKNLILASPDLDIGVFRRQIEDMGPHRPQVTLFVAQHDRALQLSRFISRGATRLGGIDPSREDYQQQLAGLSGITVIDLSAINAGDRINHDLYAASPEAVRLIGDRLLQGQVITDSDLSSPLMTADAVGSAASLLITAPIRIFDTATQR
ncbi:alpha/beta hydrolase [Chelatococcus asaccharovorans]|uniref:Esterase/lipase superfamily enzyme n=1 Tax=Chelatococcus asaccharovorans TaxID=28210 RepID=A0A2V3TZ47_9HYPH|nr:alpha/beta hydrolase [Chelatococcus asaccharovorans]MBS7707597.1 alpha/beta hydrolase [Chelatococcus asaccharovorans]PXW55171.1 esterase/lipase superfamily enzyme [Chelatococcus asaccharovorans]